MLHNCKETETHMLYKSIIVSLEIHIRREHHLNRKLLKGFTLSLLLSLAFITVNKQTHAATYPIKAVSVAKNYLGVPYVWGGMSTSGFDCSGLVKYSYSQAGVTLPRTASDMYQKGTRVSSFKTGDLLFFAPNRASKPTHVAMYVSNGNIIQAATSRGVSYSKTNNTYWKPKFIGAKRM
jgi:cell wall-associated NlpC family hydrolase